MADAVVSPLLKVLSNRLDSLAEALGYDVIFKKMRDALGSLGALASQVEEQPLGNNQSIHLWLMELKEVAYNADDLVDDWELLAMKKATTTTKVANCFSLMSDVYSYRIKHRMKDLQARFDEILKGGTALHLLATVSQTTERIPGLNVNVQTSSYISEISALYGRDVDKEKIQDMVLWDSDHEHQQQQVRVIALVGMGGIGKTALAQVMYNEEKVQMSFDLRIWVTVGEDFDLMRIAEAILYVSTHSSQKFSNMDALETAVTMELRGKRFLCVLDDVWCENLHEWEILRRWFSAGNSGSSVMLTTRNASVANFMTDGAGLYYLRALPDTDCWDFFKSLAFGSVDKNVDLEKIGMEIVRKCGGLPLAVKTLGSLLSYKKQVHEWLSILDNDARDSLERCVLPVLKLSYDHLPAHLKQCFAYCSVFPKDYAINKEELIRLWIAEGFVESSTIRKELEDVADDFFVELLQRFFFQDTMVDENGYIVECRMHNLVHDLALHVAGIECSILEDENSLHVSEHIRRISLVHESGISPKMIHVAKKLRSLFSFSGKFKILPIAFLNFRRLRVLNLSARGIRELPVAIGTLKHLRYLDLSHTYIRSIPESIANLKNLQTLELSECYNLLELPKAIRELTNLRHLVIRSCSLTHMPSGIGKLRFLQNVSAFILGKKADCAELTELGGLNLRGRLDIKNLENVSNLAQAQEAKLFQKLRLRSLGLSWGRNAHLVDAELSAEVLERLMPSPVLEVLDLSGYNGSIFPTWMESCPLINLVKVSLINCSCLQLPPLGLLPLLRDLFIKGMSAVYIIGYEFYGNANTNDVAFPALTQLELYDMPNLLEWKGFEIAGKPVSFPCLDTLTVKGCNKLTGLPSIPHLKNLALWQSNELLLDSLVHLMSLSTLAINEMPQLKSFPRDLENLNHITQLTMYDCDNLESLFEGMGGFTSLEHLSILYCKKLESLPMELRYLASLKKFDIVGCEKLAYVPEIMQHLCLLEELVIESCPVLHSLPYIPVSLKKLVIRRCPQLEKRLEKEKGDDWDNIKLVPYVQIESGEFIAEEDIF
ncbi:unnamed protein product [Prunus brigantina]